MTKIFCIFLFMKIDDYLANLVEVSIAAKMKGVRRQNIYYHIGQGNLRFRKISKTVFVFRDDVERLEIKNESAIFSKQTTVKETKEDKNT